MTFAGQEMVVLLILLAFLLFAPVPRRQAYWMWIACAALLGTARHAGTFRFTVAARDTLGAASTRTFILVVHA